MISNNSPKMSWKNWTLLGMMAGVLIFLLMNFVWAWIKTADKPLFPHIGKVSEQEYQKWKMICDAIASQEEQGKFRLYAKNFSPDFIVKCQNQAEQIEPLCLQNESSLEEFLYVCRSLGAARAYYNEVEKQTRHKRSVFPMDLLSEEKRNKVKKDDVLQPKDYENLDPILRNNLQLYEKNALDIETMIAALCLEEG